MLSLSSLNEPDRNPSRAPFFKLQCARNVRRPRLDEGESYVSDSFTVTEPNKLNARTVISGPSLNWTSILREPRRVKPRSLILLPRGTSISVAPTTVTTVILAPGKVVAEVLTRVPPR